MKVAPLDIVVGGRRVAQIHLESGRSLRQPSAEELLQRLRDGGTIVSTGALSTAEIALARADGRMWVDDDGFGYVHVPATAS